MAGACAGGEAKGPRAGETINEDTLSGRRLRVSATSTSLDRHADVVYTSGIYHRKEPIDEHNRQALSEWPESSGPTASGVQVRGGPGARAPRRPRGPRGTRVCKCG